MQFRVLGGLEVRDNGDHLDVGGVRQRRLLCALLVGRGSVVSVDRLVEQLWDDNDRPTRPESAVRTCVTRLRRALGAGAGLVVTRPPGYLLELDDHDLDATRFEQLIEARPATEAGLREALDLWRGPAFEEFADLEWCQVESERLGGLRLVGIENLHRVRLQAGETSELVPDLERDCALHPFHEPLQVLLIKALWQAGRPTDALRAAHRYRESLAGVTGLEPGSELVELEAAVLSGAAAPEPGEGQAEPGAPHTSQTFLMIDGGQPDGRDLIAAHGGRILATAGGLTAVFDGAGEAAACAVELQASDAGSSVRIGLHTGDPSGVSHCAKLVEICRAGQILVSADAAMALVDVELGEAEVELLGDYQLDELVGPEAIFGLARPDAAPGELPVVNSGRPRGNLPSAASSFVGREGELIVLAGLLGEHRVVTVTGPGGVGKTRTVLEVCSGVGEAFPDGCWLVELASVPPGRAISDPIAVGLRPLVPSATSFDQVVAGMRDRRALILLDNCEHVVGAAAEAVRQIVEGCPDCVVLCTSRQALDIAGERVFDLEPLPTGEVGHELSDGAQLLVDRAPTPRLALDERAGPSQIEAVAARLGGVPLAIELAAARLRTMTVGELERGLDHQLSLLERRDSGDGDRHRSLGAAIDWSYQLLSEPDRRLLCELSVFAGSFTEPDAVAVVGSDREVAHGLRRLVDHSLVQRAVTGDHSTFAVLESIRQFASDRLPGDGAAISRRHAEHYLELTETALAGPATGPTRHGLDSLLVELRAALERSRRSDDRALWTQLHEVLLRAAQRCGRGDLERGASANALAVADLALDQDDIDIELLQIGTRAGWLLNRLDRAIAYGERWLEAVRAESGSELEGDALAMVAKVSFQRRDLDRMREAMDDLESVAPTLASAGARASAYASLANLRGLDSQLDRALEAADSAIDAARQAGDDARLAQALVETGTVTMGVDLAEGRTLVEQGIRLADRVGDRVLVGRGLFNLADASDNPVETRRLTRRVEAAAVASGHQAMMHSGIPWFRTVAAKDSADLTATQRGIQGPVAPYFFTEITALKAHLALEAGNVEAAARFVAALDEHRAEGRREDVGWRIVALRLAAVQGDLAQAEEVATGFPESMDLRLLTYCSLSWALEELDRAGASHLLLAHTAAAMADKDTFECRYLLAWTAEAQNATAALYEYRNALDVAERECNPNYLACAHLALGRLAVDSGHLEQAELHLGASVAHLEQWPGRRRDQASTLLAAVQNQEL